MTMTTHVMQLSLMIEPVEVDNLQITSRSLDYLYPSADGDYDNSCDVTFIGTISMKVA